MVSFSQMPATVLALAAHIPMLVAYLGYLHTILYASFYLLPCLYLLWLNILNGAQFSNFLHFLFKWRLSFEHDYVAWCTDKLFQKSAHHSWCWERLKAGGEGDDWGWDGWMVSPAQWTWVWASSGSWWRTWKPGVLQFVVLQRVGHDWATEQNWYFYQYISCLWWWIQNIYQMSNYNR